MTDVENSATQQDAAPGRFKYADVNHDGVIDGNDRTFFGNPNPSFTAGLNISVTYKNFDFYTFFYAQVGNDIINNVKSSNRFPSVIWQPDQHQCGAQFRNADRWQWSAHQY